MIIKKPFFLLLTVLLCTDVLHAQDKVNVKFGDVNPRDFDKKVYSLDSNANAVIIADVGSSRIEGNNKGWFSLVYKRYRRIHILNKNAFELTNFSVHLYSDGEAEESLEKLKAVTYNLEDGKVVETKLDVKSNVFKDKLDKYNVIKKFTFPNVKEGSIIELEYTIQSDFLSNLQSWEFQGAYPRLWSEYNLTLPEFFGYVFLTQGFKKYDIYDKKDRSESFYVSDITNVGPSGRSQFTANVTDYRWVIKNVPALKEESFTSSIDNHIAKIDFHLAEKKYPLQYKRYLGNWENVSQDMLRSENFGEQLTKDNGWLKDIINPLKTDGMDKTTLAKKMFDYVRDNITCTDHTSLGLQQTLKNLVKTKNGTVSEINLLLTAMLIHEDIDANPVILSTRSNGFAYSIYPLMSQYNYVVCRAMIAGQTYYLDASEPRMGFGYLPLRCYNGAARVISKSTEAVELTADQVTETKSTSLFIINDDKGNLVGSTQQVPGYYESYDLRNKLKDKGKEEVQKDIRKDFGTEILISNFVVDSVDNYTAPVYIKYDFDIKSEKEDIIYLNPMFGEGMRENPFKSAQRAYPVEMPFAMDETFNLQLEIPAGYVVDELPESMIVKLNEADEGLFEYRISQSGAGISFRSRIRIARAYFLPEEYEMLREFFNLIVKKHAEQIVFKKKP